MANAAGAVSLPGLATSQYQLETSGQCLFPDASAVRRSYPSTDMTHCQTVCARPFFVAVKPLHILSRSSFRAGRGVTEYPVPRKQSSAGCRSRVGRVTRRMTIRPATPSDASRFPSWSSATNSRQLPGKPLRKRIVSGVCAHDASVMPFQVSGQTTVSGDSERPPRFSATPIVAAKNTMPARRKSASALLRPATGPGEDPASSPGAGRFRRFAMPQARSARMAALAVKQKSPVSSSYLCKGTAIEPEVPRYRTAALTAFADRAHAMPATSMTPHRHHSKAKTSAAPAARNRDETSIPAPAQGASTNTSTTPSPSPVPAARTASGRISVAARAARARNG